MNAGDVNELILNLFRQILQAESSIIQRIEGFNGDVNLGEKGCLLVFTLPGLYQFLESEVCTPYLAFRQRIFQGTLNADLQRIGGQVVIISSTGKVDTNQYGFRNL
ncbi:hypothetical protein [Hahella ganghwensis]|uniref:hypothetical protein n=1 Tax=Hahella ganghwensis TaxID=286420 RepID=UPI0003807711|nr:hypothetical protein [Hahella ganghwensis]